METTWFRVEGQPCELCILRLRFSTAPFSNSWIIIIIWLYIALNRTHNIDCYWGGGGGAVPKA